MESKNLKGIKSFGFIYMIGLIALSESIIQYSQWVIRLLKRWKLPDEPFFSKISLVGAEQNLSLETYLIFALLYIAFYCCIIWGFFKLTKALQLLEESRVFDQNLKSMFRGTATLFLVYVAGTFIVDVVLLAVADTNRPVMDLIASETFVFILMAYLLYFIADILALGINMKAENDLTI